ncbi:hypothetical protein [Iodobacter fluviatilis]|uniref:Lipoprotein n=1 Tax=Iodobacter fluviatilis TaxID=537 RepID=A0A377SYA4_9NEIS|nr:hypothetical protein [Iodobacter fluviatilis]TCU85010.1 hypothetical protein EV682_10833 [Iodobacter fluviatilis]STR45306.1 Uncharacterised protein [Iodobacter fluviatilis]
MKSILLISTLCSLLVACGGGDVTVNSDGINIVAVDTVPTINALRVLAGDKDTSGITPINDGVFMVEWDAKAVDAVTFNLYLSKDALVSEEDTDLFLTLNPEKNARATLKWEKDKDNISLSGVPTSVNSFLSNNPEGKGYIIAKACGFKVDTAGGSRKECVQKEVAIKLNK